MSAAPAVPTTPSQARVPTRRGLRRALAAIRIRPATLLIFTLPILGLLLYLFLAAVGDYRRRIQFDDYWGAAATMDQLFASRLRAAARVPAALLQEQRFDPERPDPGQIRLVIPGGEWDRLHDDPLAHWGEWFDAELRQGAVLSKAKVRKRGDNSVHWTTPKRSFTLRTELEETFNGHRTLALSAKDVLPAFLANRLAEEAGLFTPHTEISPVYLNDRFYGLFRMVEAIDESFLRNFDRLPGNVFRGEAAERGEGFKNQTRNLFWNPYIWDLAARNSRAASSGNAGLRALLAWVNSTTLDQHRAIDRLMHREDITRLLAVMLIVGDPYHMDDVHNQFWYEDPWSGYLHPVAWDLRLLRLDQPPMQLNSVFRAALRDPLVLDGVLRDLRHLIHDRGFASLGDSLVHEVYRRYRPYFKYEEARQGLIPEVGTPDEVLSTLHRNIGLLAEWLEDGRVAFQSTAGSGGVQVIDLETRGMAGARLTGLLAGEAGGGKAKLYADRNLNGRLDGADSVLPLAPEPASGRIRYRLVEPLVLVPGWNTRGKGVSEGRRHYRLFLTGGGPTVVPELRRRFSDVAVEPEGWESGGVILPADGWHPWQLIPRAGQVHRLSGLVRLAENLFIPQEDTLIIAPGTTLRLAPDVSVVVYGQLRAEGTAERPITVEPAVAGRPWGTFALQGERSNGSRFAHFRARGGGGAVIGEVEYTGSVSVQYAHQITIEHLEVTDNMRSDDAFHAYHATVTMTDCVFRNTIGDAIDFDFAGGRIQRCRFEQAGNDGIDLMTSNPLIADNDIRSSGDKGISVGEDSHPLVFNNVIRGNLLGMEVKDHSEPLLLNNTIVDNGVGLRVRRKNPRYGGGGWPKLINSRVTGNRQDLERDEFSRLTTLGSTLGPDSTRAASAPADLPWLYRRFGITPDSVGQGTTTWQEVAPLLPLDTTGFREDFLAVADGWSGSGGVERLEKWRDNLVLETHGQDAIITRRVNWELREPAVVLFELAGRDLEHVSVTLASDRGEVSLPFIPDRDFTSYRLLTMTLPPARYHTLTIRARAVPGLERLGRVTNLLERRNGRLELHRYGLYSMPAGAGRMARGRP
jgi:parallel beta-helix repeat protein